MLREHLSHRHTGVPAGFRPRGTDATRIEGFSDTVFAFALTLLVVSLEVPRTFSELTQAMQGFVSFGISFALLMQIWFKHYGFFRRYGLQDPPTRLLNALLLFFVLFYLHAWQLRDELSLNDIERYDTRQAILDNVLMAAVPAASVILAALLPASL